jgi:hypothetical protein
MSFQAYLDNIKAKTGKGPEDFKKLAAKKGLTKHGDIVAWLKGEFELGHGHANAIAMVLLKGESRKAAPEKKVDALFSGKKEAWKPLADRIVEAHLAFGKDASSAANETYVNLLRGKKKIGILQPSASRLDVGVKLKGEDPVEPFEAAGSWNNMVTHRARCEDPKKLDKAIVAALKRAYAAAE